MKCVENKFFVPAQEKQKLPVQCDRMKKARRIVNGNAKTRPGSAFKSNSK